MGIRISGEYLPQGITKYGTQISENAISNHLFGQHPQELVLVYTQSPTYRDIYLFYKGTGGIYNDSGTYRWDKNGTYAPGIQSYGFWEGYDAGEGKYIQLFMLSENSALTDYFIALSRNDVPFEDGVTGVVYDYDQAALLATETSFDNLLKYDFDNGVIGYGKYFGLTWAGGLSWLEIQPNDSTFDNFMTSSQSCSFGFTMREDWPLHGGLCQLMSTSNREPIFGFGQHVISSTPVYSEAVVVGDALSIPSSSSGYITIPSDGMPKAGDHIVCTYDGSSMSCSWKGGSQVDRTFFSTYLPGTGVSQPTITFGKQTAINGLLFNYEDNPTYFTSRIKDIWINATDDYDSTQILNIQEAAEAGTLQQSPFYADFDFHATLITSSYTPTKGNVTMVRREIGATVEDGGTTVDTRQSNSTFDANTLVTNPFNRETTFSKVSGASWLTIDANGTINIDSNQEAAGDYDLDFEVNIAEEGTLPGTFTVTVTNVPVSLANNTIEFDTKDNQVQNYDLSTTLTNTYGVAVTYTKDSGEAWMSNPTGENISLTTFGVTAGSYSGTYSVDETIYGGTSSMTLTVDIIDVPVVFTSPSYSLGTGDPALPDPSTTIDLRTLLVNPSDAAVTFSILSGDNEFGIDGGDGYTLQFNGNAEPAGAYTATIRSTETISARTSDIVINASLIETDVIASEDWESGQNGWTTVDESTNNWFVGTAAFFGGSQSAYVSDDGGTNNEYTNSTTATTFLYKDFTAPASIDDVEISFNWRSFGEVFYDYLQVFILPDTITPVAGTQLDTTYSVSGTDRYEGASAWQMVTNLPVTSLVTANETARIVLQWTNDGNTGTNPPAAVDDISLVSTTGIVHVQNVVISSLTSDYNGTIGYARLGRIALGGSFQNTGTNADYRIYQRKLPDGRYQVVYDSSFGDWYTTFIDEDIMTLSDGNLVTFNGSLQSLTNTDNVDFEGKNRPDDNNIYVSYS